MKRLEVELFKQQFEAFTFKTQFAAAIAGVQGGKTFVGSIWAGKKINEFPDKEGAIIAPTYKILQQSTLFKFFQQFPQLRPFYKEQKGVIELPTGGRVWIRSADQPLGLEGMTLHWEWMDEAGQMSRLAWTVARSRVSTTGGQILITTTPYSLNWLYDEFYLPWKEHLDPELSVFSWRSIDNPYFPKTYFEQERKRLSPEEFARRYEGLFTKMTGLVYDLPPDQIVESRQITANDVIAGLDFGFVNPAAVVVVKIDADNVYWITDEYYQEGKTPDELETDLTTLRTQTSFRELYPDPEDPARIESLTRRGFYVKPVDKNVELGISRVRELIRKRQLFVFNTCKNVLDEINYYHYDPDRPKEQPVKDRDHLMDALRYAIYNHHRSPVIDFAVRGGVKPIIPGVG